VNALKPILHADEISVGDEGVVTAWIYQKPGDYRRDSGLPAYPADPHSYPAAPLADGFFLHLNAADA
jgi:hypothetical protein